MASRRPIRPHDEVRIVSLVPIGKVDRALLEGLAEELTWSLRVSCSTHPVGFAADFAFNPVRRQYHSTEILKRIAQLQAAASWKVLGVTEMDLFIPVLTFVFGEAQLVNGAAVVSTYRLRQEFYGLPPNSELLRERLLKEALHELGHTYGLRHCPDYACVMSASNGIERVDLKRATYCPACATTIPGMEP